MPRTAAVDFGLKRIGVAISDENGRVALPLTMIGAGKNLDESAGFVIKILSSYLQIKTIIIGLPLMLNGQLGEMAKIAIQFADALQKLTPIPVQMMDERLSTRQVERSLGHCSRKKRSRIIDSACAALLLQTFLDKNHEPA
jgi:putative Holliday junction resolvase